MYPKVTQTLTVKELIELVPHVDGWTIGDDPAPREVFEAGKAERLRSAVKWGISMNNVDLEAFHDFGISITNIPSMFAAKLAEVAIGYIIRSARETFFHRSRGSKRKMAEASRNFVERKNCRCSWLR